MSRFIVLVTVAALLAGMLMVAGPASARGCQAFGTGVAFEVQNGTLREEIPTLAPVNDDVHFFQGILCG